MALKDEVVKLLDKNPGVEFGSGEIQDQLGVGYPISGMLAELAHEKLIRKVQRGVYTSRGKVPTNGTPHTNGNGAPKGLVGEIRKQAVLTSEQGDVVLKVDGNEFRMKWPKFVDTFIGNCDRS